MTNLVEKPPKTLPWSPSRGTANRSTASHWHASLCAGKGADTYAEPLAGMCGTLLWREPDKREIVGDFDSGVHAFWWSLIHRPEALSHMLEATPASSKQLFEDAKQMLSDVDENIINRAWAFAVIACQRWYTSPNWARGNNRLPPPIVPLYNRMKRVSLWHEDGCKTMKRLRKIKDPGNALCFSDPPYEGVTNRYEDVGLDRQACEGFYLDLWEKGWNVVTTCPYPEAWPMLIEAGWRAESMERPVRLGKNAGETRTDWVLLSWQREPETGQLEQYALDLMNGDDS